jgi:hypothetical protein
MKFNNLFLAIVAIACSQTFVSALPVDVGLVARDIGSPEMFAKRLNPQPLPPGIPQVAKRAPLPLPEPIR